MSHSFIRAIKHFCFALLFMQFAYAQKQAWLKYDYNTAAEVQKALTAEKNQNTYTFNLQGIYADLSGKPDEAIISYTKALELAKDNTGQTINILLNRAYAYNRTGSLEPTLKDCNRVIELNADLNPLYDGLAYRIMGNAYLYKDDTEKTVRYLQKSAKILEKGGFTQYATEVKGELANVYLISNDYRVAAGLYENYFKNTQNTKSRTFMAMVLNYAECLIALSRTKDARTLLMKHLAGAEAGADREMAGAFYSRLGNVENSTGNKTKASEYYKKACDILFEAKSKHLVLILSEYIKLIDNPAQYNEAIALCQKFKQSAMYKKSFTQGRFEYERAAAALYKKAGMQNEAYTALATSLELCDSLRQVNNGENTYNALAKYRTQLEEEKNKSLKQEMEDSKKTSLLVWILIAIFAVGKVFLFRSIWLKSKLNKEKIKTIEAQAALLAEQEELARQKTESQKTMIEDKEREMVAMALKMAKYNDGLQNIILQVEEKKITSLNECKHEISKIISEDGFWDYFDLRFTQLHPDFKTMLADQFPSLSKSEIDFCCLLKLNLSNKEIGSLLSISYESVISKRYRIRKKMELKEDDDLNAVLEVIL
jgi:Tetratricopeptide repeat